MPSFQRIKYEDLNARQKENYNFQKIAAKLAERGFYCMRLSDDWQGADFIAAHIDGESFLKVQIKTRFTFSKKYMGKNIFIAFRKCEDKQDVIYIYSHDATWKKKRPSIENTTSWQDKGAYSYAKLSSNDRCLLVKETRRILRP